MNVLIRISPPWCAHRFLTDREHAPRRLLFEEEHRMTTRSREIYDCLARNVDAELVLVARMPE